VGTVRCFHVRKATCSTKSCALKRAANLTCASLREPNSLTMGGPVWFQSFNDGDHELEGGLVEIVQLFAYQKKAPRSWQDDDQKETVNDLSGPEPTETLKYWIKTKEAEAGS